MVYLEAKRKKLEYLKFSSTILAFQTFLCIKKGIGF